MHYAPHILQKRVIPETQMDELGRPLPIEESDIWQTICNCRCDDDATAEIFDENGKMYKSKYHVVCDGNSPAIFAGDYVRVMNGDVVRGEGKVANPKKLNLLLYAEFWL